MRARKKDLRKLKKLSRNIGKKRNRVRETWRRCMTQNETVNHRQGNVEKGKGELWRIYDQRRLTSETRKSKAENWTNAWDHPTV